MASHHTSFGDYVLAILLFVIIVLVTARALLRAIGLRPPGKKRIYVEVPHAVEYVVQPTPFMVHEDEGDITDARAIEALQDQLLADEASLLPEVTRLYR